MPRAAALIAAPFVASLCGALTSALLLPGPGGFALLLLYLLYAYCFAALAVPLVILLARCRLFSPRAVYLYGLVCAVPLIVSFSAFGLYPLGISVLVTALVATVVFNAIFFHRVAP